MYLTEGTPNQSHQSKIDYLRKPPHHDIFHQQHHPDAPYQHSPKKTVTNIGFGPHCHNIVTTTVYLASHVDQRLQLRFQPAITGCQIIAENTTDDTPFQE